MGLFSTIPKCFKAFFKDDCIALESRQLSCSDGVCQDISLIYDCSYDSFLGDIEEEEDGDGHCGCSACKTGGTGAAYEGVCPSEVRKCALEENDDEEEDCECFNCWQVCHRRQQCIDLKTR